MKDSPPMAVPDISAAAEKVEPGECSDDMIFPLDSSLTYLRFEKSRGTSPVLSSSKVTLVSSTDPIFCFIEFTNELSPWSSTVDNFVSSLSMGAITIGFASEDADGCGFRSDVIFFRSGWRDSDEESSFLDKYRRDFSRKLLLSLCDDDKIR